MLSFHLSMTVFKYISCITCEFSIEIHLSHVFSFWNLNTINSLSANSEYVLTLLYDCI